MQDIATSSKGVSRGGKRSAAAAVLSFGLAVWTAAIYRAIGASALAREAQEALVEGTVDVVLHYSRQSAEIYVAAARSDDVLDIALAPFQYCLSAQVAQPLEAAGAERIRTAARPDEAALLELVGAT